MLALADGTVFRGRSIGATGSTSGEVVFNTSMTGYQEILTDPSYAGQIVTMTYPLIGNYGVNPEDIESRRPFIEGFVVRECSEVTSNWRATMSLDEYLKQYGIVAISDIDTRALVRHIREKGAMRACISSVDLDEQNLIAKAKAAPPMLGRNLVDEVTCGDSYEWSEQLEKQGGANLPQPAPDENARPRTAAPMKPHPYRNAVLRRGGPLVVRLAASGQAALGRNADEDPFGLGPHVDQDGGRIVLEPLIGFGRRDITLVHGTTCSF